MAFVEELTAAGKVTPDIDRRYQLEEVADALRHLDGRHAAAREAKDAAEDATA